MSAVPPPVADWVTIPDLVRDPYTIYERLRAEGGVHWVPAVNRYLVTSYEAVHATEQDQVTFSANEEGSLQIRAMGHSMLRRDDPEHYEERRAWQPVLRPGVVRKTWTSVFERNAQRYLDELVSKGPDADLVWDYAAPYAAENLREIIGFHNATQQDLQRWSQTLIDATGNYADDPEVWAKGERSFEEVDVALDEMLVWHSRHPDHSLISSLLAHAELMPIEKIRANIKMTIGGGLNEPRDALGVGAWALLTHPEQRRALERDPSLWKTAFDEMIRWVSPIGMYSRQTTREVELGGVLLPAGARLGICLLAANRDERVWPDAHRFDIFREVKPHLAFGKGVHVCLGAWVARAEVADVGLPRLFERLRGLEMDPQRPAELAGWVFPGMRSLPVRWESDAGARPVSLSEPVSVPAPKVAIVGAGPAGCFTAQALRRVLPSAAIDVFDRMPVPYGLARYGVAPDHPGTKSVTRQFDRLFTRDGLVFRGNIGVGRDVTLDALRSSYDAVVLATGLHRDRSLGVPGADLPGVIGAGVITRKLNGHPDETRDVRLGPRVAVVGNGNVAMDVVRLIARDADGFEGTDIDDEARAALAEGVEVIHVIGRSQPGQAKFDPVMVRELANLADVEHVVHTTAEAMPPGKDARWDAVRALSDARPCAPRIRVEWWFGAVPTAIEGESAVEALCLQSEDDPVHRLEVDAVVTAIGFEDDEWTLDAPGAGLDGRIEPGVYVAGWLRRGGRGTIPDQRTDARALATLIAADLATVTTPAPGIPALPHETDFDGWRRIDLRERLGAAPGRTRSKLRTWAELLHAAGDRDLPLSTDESEAAVGPGVDQAVTILFGTESGGAELVAEALRDRLEERGASVQVDDLAQIVPGALDGDRLHLIVCSTYGDGEVPTGVKPFLAELHERRPSLAGMRYAMFGMGDRSYERTYSRGSELVDEALAACGATRIGDYGRHDAGGSLDAVEVAFEWAEGVLAEDHARL